MMAFPVGYDPLATTHNQEYWAHSVGHDDSVHRYVPSPPVERRDLRVVSQGRNELCACGSGKKYKRCCR